MKILVVIPHSHSWFWSTTCIASLMRNPPRANCCRVSIVIINNSPWSPAIRGIANTRLADVVDDIIPNHKSNKFHASALDCVVEDFDFDYLMTLETDVLALRSTWLQWFVNQMKPTDYAIGHWHHERFISPCCTLYRGDVLRDMMKWCKANKEPNALRWGPNFCNSQDIDVRHPAHDYQGWYDDNIEWIAGPFAEKRGWPEGTVLKEQPSGQYKGPGWYEPGQQLHHWAVQEGYTYTICPTLTTQVNNVPVQTMYGPCMVTDAITNKPDGIPQPDPQRQLEAVELFGNAETAHLWGGTRALDIIKHDVTCQFVKANTPIWLAREARFWKHVVPQDVQEQTLDLIRRFGWHYTGQGNDHITERDRAAAEYVRECYRSGGVNW